MTVAQQYTPFMGQAGKTIGQGLMQRAENRNQAQMKQVAGQALMGDQQSMQQLYTMNPELANKIAQQQEAKANAQNQARMQQQEKIGKMKNEFMGNVKGYMEKAGEMPYEQAKRYFSEMVQRDPLANEEFSQRIIGEMTPEFHSTLASRGQSGFQGTGMDAQAFNVVMNPDKHSPEMLNAATQHLERSRIYQSPTGPVEQPGFDVSGFTPQPSRFDAPTQDLGVDIPADTQGAPNVAPPIAPAQKPKGGLKQTKTHPEQKTYNEKWAVAEKSYEDMDNYISLLKRIGPQISLGPINAKDSQSLSSAYTGALLSMKNAAELGVLAGPDMQLLEDLIPPPNQLQSFWKGKGALEAGAADAMGIITRKFDVLNNEANPEFVDLKKNPYTVESSGPKEGEMIMHPEHGRVEYRNGQWQKL